jgi:hypothetical protein
MKQGRCPNGYTRLSSPARDTRALLFGRKLLQSKLLDAELGIRGIRLRKI